MLSQQAVVLPLGPEQILQVNLCYLRVGGLLEYDKGLPYRGKQTFSDFNDAGNGIWLIVDGFSLENSPLPNGYGTLVCYVANKFVVQELYNYNTNRKWRRHRSDYGEWTDWKEL